MGFADFIEGVGQNAGDAITYGREAADQQSQIDSRKANTENTRLQTAQTKMTMMMQAQYLQARQGVAKDMAQKLEMDKSMVEDPEKQSTMHQEAGMKLEGAGDFEGAKQMYDRAKELTVISKEQRAAGIEKVKTAHQNAATAAIDYHSNPSAESASAMEKAYLSAGGDPRQIPMPGTEAYNHWADNLQTQGMDADKRIEFYAKEADKKEALEQKKKAEQDHHEETIQRAKDTAMYRESMLEFRKENAAARAASKADHDGATHKLSAPERASASRMTTASLEAMVSVQNVAQLTDNGKIHTTSGTYDNLTDHGMFGATSKMMTQSITSQNQQMYTSIMMPLLRTAATIQGGAYYKLNESQIQQEMRALLSSPGQTHMTMLEKMAELKQTIVQGQEGALDSGSLNDKQTEAVVRSKSTIEKSIPWDVSDVIAFSQGKGKAKDFGEYIKKNKGINLGSGGGSKSTPASSGKIKTAEDLFKHFNQ